jgi:hypothetical protein
MTIITVLITRWRVIKLNKGLDKKEEEENAERQARGLEPKPKGWRFPL